jgi:hypothetical protein
MANNVYLVFSEKPDHISVDDYRRWYADHAQENIESPGFVSAQRYTLQEIANSEPVGEEHHLALYEYEGDMSTWRTDLTRRIATGDVVLPEWFKQIKFKSWSCSPLGGLLTPQSR